MFWRTFCDSLRSDLLAPEKLADYAVRSIYIVLVLAAAFLAWTLTRSLVRRMLRSDRLKQARRPRTLLSLVYSLAGYVILFVALIMCLRVLGVNYSAILAGAGVVGLAVGFGAQTLVRDIISGFFLLFEDLVSVGDFITTTDIQGTVERVGLRACQIRAFDGTLFVIPNGELNRFGNQNRGFMRALVKVDLAYEQDPAIGMARAADVAEQWFKENPLRALEPPQVQGLLNLGESGITIRIVAKVKPLEHWEAERDLRLRLKKAFDASNVEIPFARRVIYVRSEPEPEDRRPRSASSSG
jgi:small conductance mechanosensitive channel